MSYFAELDSNNEVIQIIEADVIPEGNWINCPNPNWYYVALYSNWYEIPYPDDDPNNTYVFESSTISWVVQN